MGAHRLSPLFLFPAVETLEIGLQLLFEAYVTQHLRRYGSLSFSAKDFGVVRSSANIA
jgi:hypothetical protein